MTNDKQAQVHAALKAICAPDGEAPDSALAAAHAKIAELTACVTKLQSSLIAAKRHEVDQLCEPTQPAPILSGEVVATVIKRGAERQWMSEALGSLPDGMYSLYLATIPAQPIAASIDTQAFWDCVMAYCRGVGSEGKVLVEFVNEWGNQRYFDGLLVGNSAQPIAPAADVSAPTDERTRFENAMRRDGMREFDLRRDEEDRYLSLNAALLWKGWQAARAAAPVSGQGASIVESKPWDYGKSISPRQPYYENEPDGYLESDSEFMERNRFAAVWMLENANQLCIDSRPRSEDSRAKVLADATQRLLDEYRSVINSAYCQCDEAEDVTSACVQAIRALASSAAPTAPASPAVRELTDAARYQAVKSLTKEQYLAWRGVYGCADEAIDQIITAPASASDAGGDE